MNSGNILTSLLLKVKGVVSQKYERRLTYISGQFLTVSSVAVPFKRETPVQPGLHFPLQERVWAFWLSCSSVLEIDFLPTIKMEENRAYFTHIWVVWILRLLRASHVFQSFLFYIDTNILYLQRPCIFLIHCTANYCKLVLRFFF